MERTATHLLAAVAAVVLVIATWAPVITVPSAHAAAMIGPILA